jgi:hypothetical protein
MKELIIMTMQSVRKKLNGGERNYCFEIFGYDFIIDDNFKVWLIEINTNPCLEESSKLLRTLLPRMIGNSYYNLDDALRLTIDQAFPRKKRVDFIWDSSIYRVTGYLDIENMWEQLCQIGIVKVPASYKPGAYNFHRQPLIKYLVSVYSRSKNIPVEMKSEAKEEGEIIGAGKGS